MAVRSVWRIAVVVIPWRLGDRRGVDVGHVGDGAGGFDAGPGAAGASVVVVAGLHLSGWWEVVGFVLEVAAAGAAEAAAGGTAAGDDDAEEEEEEDHDYDAGYGSWAEFETSSAGHVVG